MQYDDDDHDEPTLFEPNPWGSRQRVLPRRTFKPVASVVAQLAEHAETTPFRKPVVVREADIPTMPVPKLPLYPDKPSKRADLRLWLPIGGFVAILVISLAARFGAGVPAGATSISAALGETSDDLFHIVSNVEEPPPEIVIDAPAPHRAAPIKHSTKRPQLSFDISTPLGDLAKQHRR